MTQDFLEALWGQMPDGAAIQLWEKEKKLTSYFPNPETAATYAQIAAKHGDVYLAAGLAKSVKRPARRRAGNNEIVGIPGLWADIDVIGGPEAKRDAAPDRQTAIDLARTVLEPSLIINSGYGVQAWWLFEEPWIFGVVAERERAIQLSMAFQSALRAQARLHGFGLDSTHDLARLMRLPGTLNHKDAAHPQPVDVLEDTEARYGIEALHAVGVDYMAQAGTAAAARATGGDVDLGELGDAPHERLMELMEIDNDFAAIWQRRPHRSRATWSQSQYDMSIASRLVGAGFTDQEIANSIAYHRRRANASDAKANRADYLRRTIVRARSTVESEEAEAEAEAHREATIQQLETVAKDDAAPATVTISLFNDIMGGPEIKELVQDGRDPDTARFRAVLDNGVEVPLGSISAFTDQRTFRNAFAVVTRYRPPAVKGAKWDKVIQALLNAATIREDAEDMRARRVVAWLEPYLENRMSTDREQACRVADPFEEDGLIYVSLDPFNNWVRKMRGDRISQADMKLLLEAAGFERKTINYVKADAKKSSRSYFVAEKDVLA